jgi:hypothetical protein
MFIAIVQIPLSKRPRDAAVDGEAGGGGVYLWESEAAASAWYTPDWEKRMEAAFGARPTVTYYDNHVVVDNEAGKVRIEGEG